MKYGRLLWVSMIRRINTLYLAGWPDARNSAVTLVSNRHLAFENFQRTALLAGYRERSRAAALFDALAGAGAASDPQYDDGTARAAVSLRAAGAADALDRTITASLPARYVSDPSFEFGASERGIDLFTSLSRDDPAARDALSRALAPRLADYGAYTRALVRSLLTAR